MTYTPISRGTQDWDVPLNAALATLDAGITTVSGTSLQATNNLSDLTNTGTARANLGIGNNATIDGIVFNVKDHGALGNGVADDSTAILNTINLATAGGIIYFPPGSYLLNSSTVLTLSVSGTRLVGAGTDATKLVIGASFTGTQAINITAYNCQVENLGIVGASGTTTSNPVADAIRITGVRRATIRNIYLANINGWCIYALSTNSNSTSNPLGTMISNVFMNVCAGGIRFKGDTTQNWAMNAQVNNVQFYVGGVTTGASANLDAFRIEDAWDVLAQNLILWMSNGTGASMNIMGNSAAEFIQNLDALGPTTGNNVIIQDSANGSPQNVQITGGVIQQGNVGLLISGAATQVRVSTMRIINNQTHGVSVTGTGTGINLDRLFFSLNGQAATGTIYDLNWSGTSTGFATFCRFSSPIVSTGTVGVQFSVNVAAGQSVRVFDADFEGTGNSSANWFTNFPQTASRTNDGARLELIGDIDFRYTSSTGRLSLQPTATGNRALATNVGNGTNDNFRLLGSGSQEFGLGGANARDTTWGRQGAAQIGTSDSDIVIGLVGKGLQIKGGTNGRIGEATLVGGTVTVAVPSITANSRVMITRKTSGGTTGTLTYTITAATNFIVTSSSGTDTSVIDYVVFEQI